MDLLGSYANNLKTLLNSNLRVLLLNGQNDVAGGPASTQLLANSILWKYARDWRLAPRRNLYRAGTVVGWEKAFGNLFLTMLYDTGKFVGRDQPVPALHAIDRFIQASF
jgi:hypothetical protein